MTSMTESHAPRRDAEPSSGQPSESFARPMESSRTALSDAAALADLQMHWGTAYVIGLDGDIWSATYRGTADELRAHTCLELRTMIRADYAYRQQADRPTMPGDRMSM
jgi:hypothetical protein